LPHVYLAVFIADDENKYFKLAPAIREGGRPVPAIGLIEMAEYTYVESVTDVG